MFVNVLGQCIVQPTPVTLALRHVLLPYTEIGVERTREVTKVMESLDSRYCIKKTGAIV